VIGSLIFPIELDMPAFMKDIFIMVLYNSKYPLSFIKYHIGMLLRCNVIMINILDPISTIMTVDYKKFLHNTKSSQYF
jgi:hypothetical protein